MTETTAERYRRLAGRFTNLVDLLQPGQSDASAPCAGWTVRDVVDHVTSTEQDLLAGMGFDTAPAPGPGAPWPEVRDAMQAALDDERCAGHTYEGYFGPTTFGETVDTFYVMDLVVHTWDIARGAGIVDFEAIGADDMARSLERMQPLGEAVRSPGVFGPAVAVAADASEQDRFLAWTGRQP